MTEDHFHARVMLFREGAERAVSVLANERSFSFLAKPLNWSWHMHGLQVALSNCAVEVVRDDLLERLDAVLRVDANAEIILDRVLAFNAWRSGATIKAVVAESSVEGYQEAVRKVFDEYERSVGQIEEVSVEKVRAFEREYQRFVDR